MSRDTRTLLLAGAVTCGLVPRCTRLLAGVAGAVLLSRAHGSALDRAMERAYRDFERYVELTIARHRGGLVDRADDLEDLLASQYGALSAPPTAAGVVALERIRDRVQQRREGATSG